MDGKISKGETSCKWWNENLDCVNLSVIEDCTKKCEFYNPINEEDTPPEIDKQVEEAIKNDVNLKLSGLPKFDKIHEFIVIKRHVFEIQSVSPKKIILKFKKKLKDTDQLSDGCYVFTDKEDELLLPHKVFNKFYRDAKKKTEERRKRKNGKEKAKG